MTSQPSVEARALLEDRRYASYREALEARKAEALRRLVRRGTPFETMTRLAGEVSAIDYALGLPAELLSQDPVSETP